MHCDFSHSRELQLAESMIDDLVNRLVLHISSSSPEDFRTLEPDASYQPQNL
jgi:hypothetical protein